VRHEHTCPSVCWSNGELTPCSSSAPIIFHRLHVNVDVEPEDLSELMLNDCGRCLLRHNDDVYGSVQCGWEGCEPLILMPSQ
jgi:hypothetical protein